MSEVISRSGPLFPFALFAVLWLFVTYSLTEKSGWFKLAKQYPNRREKPVLKLRFQSGWVGTVSGASIYRFEACPSGLRVGELKLFGVFTRDFFVPWSEIVVERKRKRLWNVVELRFKSCEGSLTLYEPVANRLARSVPGNWPEAVAFPPDTPLWAAWLVFRNWCLGIGILAAFFIVLPGLIGGKLGQFPPDALAVFGSMFGVIAVRDCFIRTR